MFRFRIDMTASTRHLTPGDMRRHVWSARPGAFPWGRGTDVIGPVASAALRVRLVLDGDAQHIALRDAAGVETRLSFAMPGRGAAPPPPVWDAAALAALPRAMRQGLPLHVEGPVSAGAMRTLAEMAEAWAEGARYGLACVPVTAEAVVPGLAPAPGHAALLAWQNELAATAMLAAHARGLVQGGFTAAAALRLTGLARGDDAGLAEARAGAAALGVPFLAVGSNAASSGFIDAAIGPAPLLAAMLQLAAPLFPGTGTGLIARPFRYDSLLALKRPCPAVPDVMGSDAFAVLFDGGGRAPPELARLVAREPALVAALATARGEAAASADLAFAAAGLAPPRAVSLPRRVATILALPLWRDAAAAEARAIDAAWAGPRGLAGGALRLRVAADRAAVVAADHLRWALALAGVRRPWPR
jgi:hypothetical protein